jgi:glycosyltransferase involved in cell wall biosynthesis
MSCGIPPVATNVDGTSEVIINEKTGFLVPPRNPKKLAEAILKLLSDEELRKETGINARKHIENNYDWDIITNKIEKVYENLLAMKVKWVK